MSLCKHKRDNLPTDFGVGPRSCCCALQRLMAAFVVAWREVKEAQEAAAAEEAELFKTKTHAADIPTEEVSPAEIHLRPHLNRVT
jgi:hypothetical protein